MKRNPYDYVLWYESVVEESQRPQGLRCKGMRLDDEDVDAALMAAFLKARAEPGYFRSESHFRAWVIRGAFWRAVRRWREAKRFRHLNPDSDDGSFERPDDVVPTVWKCWQDLPCLDRFLLEAHYYFRVTDAELGRQMYGSNPASRTKFGRIVYFLRHQAQARLRDMLEAAD